MILEIDDKRSGSDRRSGEDRRSMADRRITDNLEAETAKELAVHAVEIKHLQEDIDCITKTVSDMNSTLHEISRTLSEAKGGWRTLIIVGGAVGTLTAIIPWATDHLMGR